MRLRQSLDSSLLHLKAGFALKFLYTSLPYPAADGSKLLYTTLYNAAWVGYSNRARTNTFPFTLQLLLAP